MPIRIDGTGYIGTANNIYTDASGQVGLGTTTPTTKLEVNAAGVNGIHLNNPTALDSPRLLFTGSGGPGTSCVLLNANGDFRFGTGGTVNSSSGTERMRIDSSGRVTMPYQPFVAASKSTGSGWANWYNGGNGATFIFNSVYTNNGNHYNSTTGIFTCPVAGYYKVNASILMGNNTSTAGYFYLYKNGSSVQSAAYFYGGSGAASGNGVMEWIVYCAANDQLKIQVAGGNAAVIYESGYNSLTIALIG